MGIIIVSLLVAIWIYSYVSFKKRINYFYHVSEYLNNLYQIEKDDFTLLRLACAYMETQRYKDAYECYQKVNWNQISPFDKMKYSFLPEETLSMNIHFCEHPVPGVSYPKNFHKSWLHNFVLARLGNRRIHLIIEEDFIHTDELLQRKSY